MLNFCRFFQLMLVFCVHNKLESLCGQNLFTCRIDGIDKNEVDRLTVLTQYGFRCYINPSMLAYRNYNNNNKHLISSDAIE